MGEIGPASASLRDAMARHPSPVLETRVVYRAEARRRRAKDGGPEHRQLEPDGRLAPATRASEGGSPRRLTAVSSTLNRHEPGVCRLSLRVQGREAAPTAHGARGSAVAHACQASRRRRHRSRAHRRHPRLPTPPPTHRRIPRDLELPGRAATLRKEGSRLIVEPVAGPSLRAVLAKLKPLEEESPVIDRLDAEPVEV
jgi:antitoxin VapB